MLATEVRPLGPVKRVCDPHLWIALALILSTAYLTLATYLHWITVTFPVSHALTWIGTLYIAAITPAHYVLRRRLQSPRRTQLLRNIHMYGNLIAFMFISIHFAQQVGRPPQAYPELGTGLTLYITTLVLVATGFMQRFRIFPRLGRYGAETARALPHHSRSIHIGTTMAFYLVIVTHVLHGIRVL